MFPVTVECVSCSPSLPSASSSSSRGVGYGDPLVLSGACEQCGDHAQVKPSSSDQVFMLEPVGFVSRNIAVVFVSSIAIIHDSLFKISFYYYFNMELLSEAWIIIEFSQG